MRLVFATNNLNKLQEARHILPPAIQLAGLNEIGCAEDLPETHDTLQENALEKALYVFNHYKADCFSEDAGLEVHALNGEPGVYSARYAGPGKNSDDNIRLLLQRMNGVENRKARFRAVIALILNGQPRLFEGVVNGRMLTAPAGNAGFGYDPVFVPDGFTQSFAQMSLDQKSKISHRRMALEKMKEFLESRM